MYALPHTNFLSFIFICMHVLLKKETLAMCFKCGLDYKVAGKTEHRMPLLVLFRHRYNFK